MSPKEHGTSHTPVQSDLRWGVDRNTADRICNYNRRYAEYAGSFAKNKQFRDEVQQKSHSNNSNNSNNSTHPSISFYDSNTGKLLFRVPSLSSPSPRSLEDFWEESKRHGWPSFRDEEVNWDVVRVLEDGETVSIDGTHLGHNLPDGDKNKGKNRFCINLVSVAGREEKDDDGNDGNDEKIEEEEEEARKEDAEKEEELQKDENSG